MLATPIGNLRDITLRALDVLAAVHLVAAEDTRVTRHLLTHYGINAKIVSLREHNEVRQTQHIITRILQGQAVALVSDAGTPCISDPGTTLVRAARAAGVPVVAIPGPCALVAAVSAVGWTAEPFSFHGFLPAKASERRRMLEALKVATGLLVFYEAPHRVEETLQDLMGAFGAERQCGLFRELTKKFEDSKVAALVEVLAWVRADLNRVRGEFVLVLEGAQPGPQPFAADADRILRLLCAHLTTKDAARIAAELTGEKRDRMYQLALQYKSTSVPKNDAHD